MAKLISSRERRRQLLTILKNADRPVTGRELSDTLGVARQIIVGDVALLRSSGMPILSSARGYELEGNLTKNLCYRQLQCRINPVTVEKLQAELDTVVDNGGTITAVTIDSEAYGRLQVHLELQNRRDVKLYLQRLENSQTPLLCSLTRGIHRITIETKEAGELEDIVRSLKEQELLLEDKEKL